MTKEEAQSLMPGDLLMWQDPNHFSNTSFYSFVRYLDDDVDYICKLFIMSVDERYAGTTFVYTMSKGSLRCWNIASRVVA